MITKRTLITQTSDVYRNVIKNTFDGFVNGNNYAIDLNTESQNPVGGNGIKQNIENVFNVSYDNLKILSKPTLIELKDKSAINIKFPNIYQNPAIISGDSSSYSYIDNFLFNNNTALNLNKGTTLTYNSTVVPYDCFVYFMYKINKDYDGLIYSTKDNEYQIGYDGTQQKFYTIINNIKNYSEVIKITENPFVFFVLNDHIVIRQYNIYNKLSNIKNLSLSDMKDLPLAFMIQENN